MEVLFRLISAAKPLHTIKKITKDGTNFPNPPKGFKIDSTGKVYTDATHELPSGNYIATISTKDELNRGIKCYYWQLILI
ncbi:hypothetical protein [Flavivirga eckloniae]|uniref:Uncharacterized protein n=1 Tax=Flavivirga eckloniae TaxID=1803846 RepID=A0A2K9PQR9_9FLAO|nr:hypothetical protein [Flavivirga eckloniae]AUP79412.1 hypothetical protein C1H87_12110 [Flavivirga eckloniae]